MMAQRDTIEAENRKLRLEIARITNDMKEAQSDDYYVSTEDVNPVIPLFEYTIISSKLTIQQKLGTILQ